MFGERAAGFLEEIRAAVVAPEVGGRLDGIISRLSSFRMNELFKRVRAAAANDDWAKFGLRDPVFEASLDRLASKIGEADEKKSYELPVRFADVRPNEDQGGSALNRKGSLRIMKSGKVSHLNAVSLL